MQVASAVLLVIAALQVPSEKSPGQYSCGPFLLQPGAHTMTVVVDHEVPLPAEIHFQALNSTTCMQQTHPEPARHHVFTLSGLQAETIYSYEISSGDVQSEAYEFRTLPERPESYRVLVMGDVRSQPDVWGEVSRAMLNNEADALFTIGTGDYPSDGSHYKLWVTQFYEPARAFLARMPLWPAIGNHEATRPHDDVTNLERSHFFSLFDLPGNERWYRVDYPLMTLLVLDSNSHMSPGKEQYEWLLSQLKSPRNRFTLIAMHHAPFSSGPHERLTGDGTPNEWPIDEGRRFLVPLCEMYGVDIVLAGHDHLYERSTKDGVLYIVTGGGGAPLYKIDSVENPYQEVAVATHHYVVMEVSAEGIQLKAFDREAMLIDEVSVPVTEKHLKRRERAVLLQLEQLVRFGPLDLQTGTIQARLRNPFDYPLQVELKAGRRGNSMAGLEGDLAVGEERVWPVAIGDLPAGLAHKPWLAWVGLDLRMKFSGRDQGFEFDQKLNQRATLHHPLYAAQKLDGVAIDGSLAEWNDIPTIVIDENSPIIKNEKSFGGPADFSAQLRIAHGEGQLYLALDVTDDQLVNLDSLAPDKSDCLLLLLQGAGGKPNSVTNIVFGAEGRIESAADISGISYVARKRAGGWTLEASLPLDSMGFETDCLSCDALIVDRDSLSEDAKPSYHRLWSDGRSLLDTQKFGKLQLVGAEGEK